MTRLKVLWTWLLKPDNRATLAFIGSGIAVIVYSIWCVYIHFDSKSSESKIAPWRIDSSARAELIRVLRSKGAPHYVNAEIGVPIACRLGDMEGIQFATDLKEYLSAARWYVRSVTESNAVPISLRGLLIRVKSGSSA